MKPYLHEGILHFSCVKESLEDLTNVEYLRDCAMQAGLETKLIFIDEIGWDSNTQQFVDVEDESIKIYLNCILGNGWQMRLLVKILLQIKTILIGLNLLGKCCYQIKQYSLFYGIFFRIMNIYCKQII